MSDALGYAAPGTTTRRAPSVMTAILLLTNWAAAAVGVLCLSHAHHMYFDCTEREKWCQIAALYYGVPVAGVVAVLIVVTIVWLPLRPRPRWVLPTVGLPLCFAALAFVTMFYALGQRW